MIQLQEQKHFHRQLVGNIKWKCWNCHNCRNSNYSLLKPNITSVGTLSDLTVGGDTTIGQNLTVTGNLTIKWFNNNNRFNCCYN